MKTYPILCMVILTLLMGCSNETKNLTGDWITVHKERMLITTLNHEYAKNQINVTFDQGSPIVFYKMSDKYYENLNETTKVKISLDFQDSDKCVLRAYENRGLSEIIYEKLYKRLE